MNVRQLAAIGMSDGRPQRESPFTGARGGAPGFHLPRYSSAVSGAKTAISAPAAATGQSTCAVVAVLAISVRVAVTRRLTGLVSLTPCSQPGMVAGSTKMLLMNVTGNKITKPMLITAFGERRTSPSVIQAHDRAEANSRTSAVARIRPDLTAFFACLYYAALRPEEAIALRSCDCHLPDRGWGMLTLTAASPRTATAWTGDGSSHEQRGLKHRPDGAVRMVPIPPVLAAMLRTHYRCHGTAPDGRLFHGARGGPLSESVYGRVWHAARTAALGPELTATGLARRPYDLRHAALSLWINADAPPAEVAARAGHSVTVLLSVYAHCIDGQGPDHQPARRARPPPRQPGAVPESKRFREPPVPPGPCPLCVREPAE